jgi:hypothetical protein
MLLLLRVVVFLGQLICGQCLGNSTDVHPFLLRSTFWGDRLHISLVPMISCTYVLKLRYSTFMINSKSNNPPKMAVWFGALEALQLVEPWRRRWCHRLRRLCEWAPTSGDASPWALCVERRPPSRCARARPSDDIPQARWTRCT